MKVCELKELLETMDNDADVVIRHLCIYWGYAEREEDIFIESDNINTNDKSTFVIDITKEE